MKPTVMSFTQDEMETNINYDYITDTWTIETNVRKHMTILSKKYSDYVTITTTDSNGRPTSIIARGLKEVISFRSLKD